MLFFAPLRFRIPTHSRLLCLVEVGKRKQGVLQFYINRIYVVLFLLSPKPGSGESGSMST